MKLLLPILLLLAGCADQAKATPEATPEAPPGWTCSKDLLPYNSGLSVYTLTETATGRRWTIVARGHGLVVLEKP